MPSPKSRNRSSNASRDSAGAAIRRGDLKISDPIPFDTGFNGGPLSSGIDMSSLTPNQQHDATWDSRKVSPSESQPPSQSILTSQGELSNATRASAGPSVVPSSLSTDPSKHSLHQKKNSGFRATLKRMFSRSGRGRASIAVPKEYYLSDPGNLASIVEKQTDPRVTHNAGSCNTAGTVTRSSALGSHNPILYTIDLPRTSSERNRLKSPRRRRRRDSLPSLMLTDQEAQILAGPNDDLSAKLWKRAQLTEAQLKRRSRSADALNDLVASYARENAPPRDRESEIAYWRTSIIEYPTPTWLDNPANSRQQSFESDRNASKHEPVQTFDFGLTKPGTDPASLEDRITTLEVKWFDHEYAIARLQGNNLPKPILYAKPAKRRSIHELFPDNGTKSTLESSSSGYQEPTSFLTSPDESPMPSTEQEENFRPDRSSKATTIRPLTTRCRSSRRSNAPSPSPARISSDQFDALMEMFKQEQAARKRLEVQMGNCEAHIAELEKELNALRTPVYAEIRPMTYATPSPESIETPVAQRSLHRSPRFEHQYEKLPLETSRFSMSEIDTDAEEGFQDVYETPQENRFTFETTRASPLVGVS